MSRRRPCNPQLCPPLHPLPPPQPAQPQPAPPRPAMQHHDRMDGRVTRCCAPTECVRVFTSNNNNGKEALIHDLRDAVRVVCNNDTCTFGEYMHRECFDQFEQSVLTYLKSCGRARSWSERQRCQNLWTKKGYDLAFKACGCRCGRGHLRKDLDWTPPAAAPHREEEVAGKKKKRRNKNNARPALTINSVPHYAVKNDPNNNFGGEARGRTGSLSSGSTGSSSPPANGILASGLQTLPMPGQPHGGAINRPRKVAGKGEVFSDRHGAGGNGIFARRLDFSSFNVLPRIRLNSYHIKMEDEGNHGNDETRCFILSTLAAHQLNRTACLLCGAAMAVFDRYPLVDGTFFLTPRKHSAACLATKVEGRTQYLSAVCMGCMENKKTTCRACAVPWDGSSLVLGTMYSYDIFAAMPCCAERYKCNSCKKPLLSALQRLNYFSDYSQDVACPHCGVSDHHFIKSLAGSYHLTP